jgi:uncharacterized protein (DUF2267 family)
MTYEEFVQRVQQFAQVDDIDKVVRAIHATLQTLVEHLSGGEAHDLRHKLPTEFMRSVYKTHEEAEAFPLSEFFSRISERAGVSEAEARTFAIAVMLTLREAIDKKELADIFAQLPEEYDLFFRMPTPG